MEQYIDKLSQCQQNENQLRNERETVLKRHEQELVKLDERLANISQQRTEVIDQFKQFLDSLENLSRVNNELTNATTLNTSTTVSKLNRTESADATISLDAINNNVLKTELKPFQTQFLPVDSFNSDGGKSSSSSPSPHSVSHSPNPMMANEFIDEVKQSESTSIKANSDLPTSQVNNDEQKKKSGRFKFVHRLTMSKSLGSMPSAITVASPTTTQIESMLTKVRENVHSLDDSTLNQCIDLLSSRIMKDKEIATLTLNTPEPKQQLKVLTPFKREVAHKTTVTEEKSAEVTKRENTNVSKEKSKETTKEETTNEKKVTRPSPIKGRSISRFHY